MGEKCESVEKCENVESGIQHQFLVPFSTGCKAISGLRVGTFDTSVSHVYQPALSPFYV